MKLHVIFRLSKPQLFASREKVDFLAPPPRTVSAPALDWPLDLHSPARPKETLRADAPPVEAARNLKPASDLHPRESRPVEEDAL